MKKVFLSIYFVSLLFFAQKSLYSLAVGSNTTPSRQGFTIFPSGATDNAMIGYASFENGFKLADNGASCSFDGLFPVSGTIDLIGGNLYLMESLELSNTSKINTMGNLYGNGKTLKLPASITELRSTATDLMLTLTSYNMGTPVSGVDFSTSFSYAIGVANYNVSNPELCMFFFDGTKLTVTQFVNYGTNRDAITCRWQPGYTNFVVGINSGVGAQLYSYSYVRSSGLFTNVSTLNLPSGQSINAVCPSRGGNYVLVGRSTASGGNKTELFMYSMSPLGALSAVLNQAFAVDHDVSKNALSWSPGGNYLVVGTTPIAGDTDLKLYNFNGTTLTDTISIRTGFTVRGVDWSPTGTFIAVAFTGSTTQNLMIYTHDISSGTLTPKTSANINQSTDVVSVSWTADGNRLLVGTSAAGGIAAMRQYTFDRTATTLSLVNSISFDAAINSVRALQSNDQYMFGVGNYVYISGSGYSDGFTLTADQLTIELSNDIILGTPVGFTRKCAIIGNNHAIDFDTTGTMIVLPQASLYLKDVTLRNFGGTQLRCLDNTATISLDNVRFIFNSPYFFDAGTLNITNNFDISGTNSFIYRSTASSIIYARSSWNFDVLSTLSYVPRSNNRQGIQLFDQSSSLVFNNATLYMTQTGLILTKGQFVLDGKVTISSDAASTAEGFVWGDGITSQNDLSVRMMSNAKIDLLSGFIVNRNILS